MYKASFALSGFFFFFLTNLSMFGGNARNAFAHTFYSFMFFYIYEPGELLLQLAGHLFSNVFIFSARIVKRAGRVRINVLQLVRNRGGVRPRGGKKHRVCAKLSSS